MPDAQSGSNINFQEAKMGVSISGSNAIFGLSGNDTDFEKVLSQLKQIESTQLNRLEAWKSDWKLRYDAFTQIIDQIQAASSMLAQLSDKNNFVAKLVQSSNDNVITAVANASAQDVQHTIKVSQTASNAIWANTGHVFDSKTDVINTTGTDQYFSYTYAGKKHDFKVPANTTLESFASMINNSADNPGIKVSLIQTGNGYVFQVAGKDTGAVNDLIIHDSNLVGMSATGSVSTWQTNNSLNISDQLTDPSSYVFDLVLQGGAKKSVTVKGSATADELVTALNNAAGGVTASLDGSGNLVLEGVQSFSRRLASDAPYTPGALKLSVADKLEDPLNAPGGLAAGLGNDDLVKFTMTLEDGTEREISLKAGASNKEMLTAIVQATQPGDSADIGLVNSQWTATLSGVTALEVESLADGKSVDATKIQMQTVDPKGVKNVLGAELTSATTTITFKNDKLAERLDGKKADEQYEKVVFTVVEKDGTPRTIELDGNKTFQDLLDEAAAKFGADAEVGTDDDGNATLELTGVKSFRLTGGAIQAGGFSTTLKSTMTAPATNPDGVGAADNLFYTDGDGNILLEEPPNLVYTFAANSGNKGTLTLPSGTSMKDVLAALKNPDDLSVWTWSEGSAPADFSVRFTDASGKEYVDADGNPVALEDIDGPVYLNLGNVQSVSGPGISGQIATTSNWNIQRAANARFQVDNWPVEMESDSNRISDVIEGVVFTIQETGEARISVSTDITSVEQSIQNFLDAVNSVLLTVNDLMKYDETKEVTSNDPDDIGSSNYSASGLTNQKGSLLTGNYGVQLFKSRFSSMLGTPPPGFQSRSSATDILSGDVLASLANLGIKTDTDATSDTYGLLVIAPSSGIGELQSMDKANYTDMITNHLEAVVDFFCASGTGSSSSTDFRYGSHVEGITKAGNYEVKYTVLSDGTITNVTVGGEPAKRDESMPGYYFSVASGDPRGLALLIDDLTVGDHPPAGSDPMYVRIKQGLVQTTNNFLKSELVFNDVNIPANATNKQVEDAIALKSKNGALMSLRANYQSVMEGIDAKIEREQRRLSTWEARQKAIFSNLETLLKQYSEQQTSLEAQLKQLSGNSK